MTQQKLDELLLSSDDEEAALPTCLAEAARDHDAHVLRVLQHASHGVRTGSLASPSAQGGPEGIRAGAEKACRVSVPVPSAFPDDREPCLSQGGSDKARRIEALRVSLEKEGQEEEEEEEEGQDGREGRQEPKQETPDKAAIELALLRSRLPWNLVSSLACPCLGQRNFQRCGPSRGSSRKQKRSFPPAVISPLGSALGLFSATFGRHGVCVRAGHTICLVDL